MTDTAVQSLSDFADTLANAMHGKTFGGIFFWRFALVRPHDQAYSLLSVRAEGERLDLTFRHASGAGTAGVLSVFAPAGLQITDAGICVRTAARLRLDESEAWPDGGEYRIRTPRGEGQFAIGDSPALTLQF